jgi:hypothetical protein
VEQRQQAGQQQLAAEDAARRLQQQLGEHRANASSVQAVGSGLERANALGPRARPRSLI